LRRVEVSPAALGSVFLHGAVALALMISWGSRDLKVGSVVPVTIVTKSPDTTTRAAEQAPEAQTAQTEEPVPEAPPQPTPPPPQPAPAPTPKPAPVKPTEKAPTPTPTKPAPAKPAEKSLDFDALAASLTKPARNAPQRPSSAAQGATRPETAPVARTTVGTGLASGAAVQGMVDDLQRRWHPNCEVEGGRDVIVKVTFRLGVGGQLIGDATSQVLGARTAVAQVGAERAVRAVYSAAPFRGLPEQFYHDTTSVTFDAREACSR